MQHQYISCEGSGAPIGPPAGEITAFDGYVGRRVVAHVYGCAECDYEWTATVGLAPATVRAHHRAMIPEERYPVSGAVAR